MDAVEFLNGKRCLTEYCSIPCGKCPLGEENNGYYITCADLFFLHPERAVEIVEKWRKEHPKITNADKFKEVFGEAPVRSNWSFVCPPPKLRNKGCKDCETCLKWWEEEYKGETERVVFNDI